MNKIIYQFAQYSGVCRICRSGYVDNVPEDQVAHRAEHKKLAAGGLPRVAREFLKKFGWAVAHNDRGLDRLKEEYNAEDGKLAVVYAWWIRAHLNGCPTSDFDAFMQAHFSFADADVTNNQDAIAQAQEAIKPWARFAG